MLFLLDSATKQCFFFEAQVYDELSEARLGLARHQLPLSDTTKMTGGPHRKDKEPKVWISGQSTKD